MVAGKVDMRKQEELQPTAIFQASYDFGGHWGDHFKL
jgi:hypothetical protein